MCFIVLLLHADSEGLTCAEDVLKEEKKILLSCGTNT